MNRVEHLLQHLQEKPADKLSPHHVGAFSSKKSNDDIVIVSCIRTAICKAKRGSFKDTAPTLLLAPVLKYVIKDIDPKLVEDICVGSVLARGGLRATECRQAAFIAGYPKTTTLRTVNRQCSSGLQSIADIASSIRAGYINVGVAAGLESMSADSMNFSGSVPEEIKQNENALNCYLPMGITSENVASQYGITREEQDKVAVMSHQRASAAKEKFRQEILPITTSFADEKTGKKTTITVRDDDGVRGDTTYEKLQKLEPSFKKNGTTTRK